MTYLVSQMLLCLLLAALFGFLIGWALRAMKCRTEIARLENEWSRRSMASVASPPGQVRDDLRKIEGIGPKIEGLLNDKRIFTFADLAAAPTSQLKDILRRAGDRYRMHNPKTWPEQATLAAEGRWEELSELQDTLIAGRDS